MGSNSSEGGIPPVTEGVGGERLADHDFSLEGQVGEQKPQVGRGGEQPEADHREDAAWRRQRGAPDGDGDRQAQQREEHSSVEQRDVVAAGEHHHAHHEGHHGPEPPRLGP